MPSAKASELIRRVVSLSVTYGIRTGQESAGTEWLKGEKRDAEEKLENYIASLESRVSTEAHNA